MFGLAVGAQAPTANSGILVLDFGFGFGARRAPKAWRAFRTHAPAAV
jgi:hypothetical protein